MPSPFGNVCAMLLGSPMLPGGGKVVSSADDECAGRGSLDVAFVMSPRINSSCSEKNSEAVAGGTVVPGLLSATGVELVLVDDGVAMEDLVAHQ